MEEEIRVELNEQKMTLIGINIQQVKNRLAQENINLAGGNLKEGQTEYIVRTLNEFREVDEIKEVVIGNWNGREIKIRDVADVSPGSRHAPFAISWENAAEVFSLGLEIPFERLPSRCEVFNVFTDMPHGKFSNEKAVRVLGFQPRNDIAALWTRDKT